MLPTPKPKLKKTIVSLKRLELSTRQISQDMLSQQHYDLNYVGEYLLKYAEWIEEEIKKIEKDI